MKRQLFITICMNGAKMKKFYYARSPILGDANYFQNLDVLDGAKDLTSYREYLFKIKKELFFKIMGDERFKRLLMFNNKSYAKISKKRFDIHKFPNNKEENGIIKTFVSYVYRSSFKMMYGCFSNFYTILIPRDKPYIEKRIVYTEDDNSNCKKILYLNPCHIKKDDGIIFFNINDGKNTILKLDNFDIVKQILNNPENKKLEKDKQLLINAGILRENFSSVDAIFFKEKIQKSLPFNKLNLNAIYNVLNSNNFYMKPTELKRLEFSKLLYISFYSKYYQTLNNEKKLIINRIRKYKKRIKLLEFILENFTFIDELYNARSSLNKKYTFIPEFMKRKFQTEIIDFYVDPPKILKSPLKCEAYISTCVLNDNEYCIIDSISPRGVFSSRVAPHFKKRHPQKTNMLIECLYNPDETLENFHSFKRGQKSENYLNINCYNSEKNKSIRDIKDAFLIIKHGKILLYFERDKKSFDPVFHSTLPNSCFIVTKFLRMIGSYQQETYELPNVEEYFLNENNYLPRILCGNTVLQRRTWKINSNEIKIIRNTSLIKFENFSNFVHFCKVKNLPRYVLAFKNFTDNKRIIDLYNPYSVVQLIRFIQHEDFFYFEEMLPAPQTMSKFDKQNGFFTQILI